MASFIHRVFVLCLVATAMGPTPASSADSIAAPGAVVEKLADGFTFTEGPSADGTGAVFFTDQPNNRIHKWNTDSSLSVFLEPAGRSNGLCFDGEGNLWACADEKNQLWKISPDGTHTVVLSDYNGKRFNGPNDVWVHSSGGVYFTDPYYKRPYWTREKEEQDRRAVYFLSADRKRVIRVAEDLEQPNGLVGTADGNTLYVADIKAGKTFAYAIRKDGSLEGQRLFCEQGSDGMTLDQDGRVYLTGKGVSVFSQEGQLLEHIPVPEPWTANVCFGGPDRSLLFITAGKSIYGLRTQTRGASPQ